VAVSADGTTAVSGGEDHRVIHWDLRNGTHRVLEGHSFWVTSVAVSADGTTAVSGGWDHRVIHWDLRRGTGCVHETAAAVSAIALTPEASRLVIGDPLGRVAVFDVVRPPATSP
jgi:WD40 repeat protein